MEQQRLLRHVGNLAAQALLRAARDILTVHEHAAALDIVQAQQQLGERRLTRARFAHQAHALARRHMKCQVIEHVLARRSVTVRKAQVLKINRALGYFELRGVRVVCHQTWLVQHARHLGRIAQRAVDALHHGTHVVQAHGEVIGVGKDHDERAGRDAKPRIAARHEHTHHGHGDDDKARGRKVSLHHGVHRDRLGVARGAIGGIEQVALKVLAPAGLDGQDVRDRVRQDTRELVLCSRRRGRKWHDAFVHKPDKRNVDDHDGNQGHGKCGHHRGERRHRADDRGDGGDERIHRYVHQTRIAAHKTACLAHKRSAKAAGMECHGLVGERVEAQTRQVIVARNLELVDGVVLQLGEDLTHQVNEHERQDIGGEDLKHLVTRHGTGLNAVDNEGHHIGIGKRQQKDVARRREHREKDNQRLRARDTPKPLQRAAHGGAAERAGASLRHGLPFASDRAKRHCCTLKRTSGKRDAKSGGAPAFTPAPHRPLRLVLVFLVCE